MNNEPQEKNEGGTPRTDAIQEMLDGDKAYDFCSRYCHMQGHARTLERELTKESAAAQRWHDEARRQRGVVVQHEDSLRALRAQLAARPTAPEPEQQGEATRESVARACYGFDRDEYGWANEWEELDQAQRDRYYGYANRVIAALKATPARVDEGRGREKQLEEALRGLLSWADTMKAAYEHPFLNDTHVETARALLTPPVSATKATP